ncbi:MAG: hypothetical protein ACXVJD_06415 [Mucilaginibacter sp.]
MFVKPNAGFTVYNSSMAKDIKALQCPKCGSVYKTETKPDFYRCENCGTEYYLDSDDMHVYYHHERAQPLQSSAPPGNTRLTAYIFAGAFLFIVIAYFVSILFKPESADKYKAVTSYKMPRSYYSSLVYTNTATGDPVYLRIGGDNIDKGNNKSELEVHDQFNNALNGKLIADRIVPSDDARSNRCLLSFKAYSPDTIYAIGCETMLLQLDTRNNRLNDITQTTFKDFTQLSSGIAKLEFDFQKAMINVMNNEGKTYYYFPALKKLTDDYKQADDIWKQQYDHHYVEFGNLSDDVSGQKNDQLIEVKYAKQAGQNLMRDVTPGRKYFNPKLLYQDTDHVLIVVNTTPSADPPVSIQCIDIRTGKLQWALPPDRYDLYSATKCKQGYAVEYRRGDEADYVHGVLVISAAGILIYNYKLSRLE